MNIFDGYSRTAEYEKKTLDWIRLKARNSATILKKESGFNQIQTCINFINGAQGTLGDSGSRAISTLHDNKIKKIVLETVSALTDVRPIWNYETSNDDFKEQATVLNKLARGWWKNSRADRSLQSILTFSCVGGSGYGYLQWNEELNDFELLPTDPRDVLPIDPVYNSDTIQAWGGVIVRERRPLENVRQLWPEKAHRLKPSSGSDWFGIDEGRGGRLLSKVRSTFEIIWGGNTLPGLEESAVDVLKVFLHDNSLNTGDAPVKMGQPGSNWEYVVYPLGSIHPVTNETVTPAQAKLYPRGRLVICTPTCILDDGPNPNWHGKFPLIRFTLDPVPWLLLGSNMVADLLPLQGSLNECLRGMDDAVGLWIHRGAVGDQTVMSASNIKAIDTRRPGLKVKVNSQLGGKGFEVIDGPSLPAFFLEYPTFLKGEMDENSGVLGLMQAAQAAKQLPSDDKMEQFSEALSPLLKMRSRSIEISLAELAEMLKVGFFQYYDGARRMQMLGPTGLVLEDFDYDPNSLVPAGDGSREDRAKEHHKKFTFSIAPNSFLNVSHTAQKLMILQLFRANGIDIWSMWESMDLPDIGPKPGETITDRMVKARELGLQQGPTPELNQAQLQAAIAGAIAQTVQAQMMIQQSQMAPVGPVDSSAQGAEGGGQPPPEGGGGMPVPSNSGVGAQGGRPPSGGAPPQMVQKSDGAGGTRTVVSESGG